MELYANALVLCLQSIFLDFPRNWMIKTELFLNASEEFGIHVEAQKWSDAWTNGSVLRSEKDGNLMGNRKIVPRLKRYGSF